MGNCRYCGESAGIFRSKHKECESRYEQGCERILNEVLHTLKTTENYDELERKIMEIANSSFIITSTRDERKDLLLTGWEKTVENFLEDGLLDESEERRLVQFKDRFALLDNELDRKGWLMKATKAAVLRDVCNGIVPQRLSTDLSFSINFQRNEKIVWIFSGCKYLEDKTRRQRVGRSQGVSVRVMKGVYYRVGAFKGHTVEYNERVHVDTGAVVLTDKNIYFAGSQKSMRIPFSKIVAFEPFNDGIGIMRDAATAKAQIFVTGDGWFTYNLAINLSQM